MKPKMKKVLKRIFISILSIVIIIFLAFQSSPYPSVLIIRYAFNKEAIEVNDALEKHVPDEIEAIANVQYDPADSDALLDAYFHPDSVN